MVKVQFHPFENVSFLGKECLFVRLGGSEGEVGHSPRPEVRCHLYSHSYRRLYDVVLRNLQFQGPKQNMLWRTSTYFPCVYTQCVQVLLGLCSLKIQDVNYFQNFTLSIQTSLLLNQYIAGIDLKVFENSHCTPFVESHLKLR
jgi:hypothetical protein